MNPIRRYYIILFALVVLFAAPGLSAYFFYYHPQWLSSVTTNKGQLINPPIRVPALTSKTAKWQFVLWRPEGCDVSCMKQLEQLSRVRVALGRRLYDVDLVVLMNANGSAVSDGHAKLLSEQNVSEVRLSARAADKMTRLYNKPMFFIANPEHYLVLAYQTTSQPDDLFHDIKLLLTKGTSN